MLSLFEEWGLLLVVGLFKHYAAEPKKLAPYKAVIEHIAADSATILAGINAPGV